MRQFVAAGRIPRSAKVFALPSPVHSTPLPRGHIELHSVKLPFRSLGQGKGRGQQECGGRSRRRGGSSSVSWYLLALRLERQGSTRPLTKAQPARTARAAR